MGPDILFIFFYIFLAWALLTSWGVMLDLCHSVVGLDLKYSRVILCFMYIQGSFHVIICIKKKKCLVKQLSHSCKRHTTFSTVLR